jgi:integrase/recombinase XerD
MKKKIILKRVFHRDKWRILISFNYDKGLAALVRQINGNSYSATYKNWYVDDNEETLKQILLVFKDRADIDISMLTQKPAKYVETDLRPVSPSKNQEDEQSKSAPDQRTVLTVNKPETKDSDADIIPIKKIIKQVVERERFSPVEFRINEQDGRLAIRFTGHYDREWIKEIESFGKYYYDKGTKEFLLPWSVMTGDSLYDYFSSRGVEVKRILNSTRNTKHKLLLWIIYSCGLRRSEVINIRLNDLDRDRSVLHIKEGKGGVDRIVPVSNKVWEKLDEYIDGFHPAKYLFEGQRGGKYSVESVYRVFKQALHTAGIKKDVGVHSLRHSYATHLHESGLDIRYIQELLGHRSTRTTEIYTHVSRRNLAVIRSPIEDMDVR